MSVNINILKKLKVREVALYGAVFILCCFILFNPNRSANGAKNGIIFCVDVLVPSLFPFMAIASLIVNTGISDKLSPAFGVFTKKLFKLPGCTGSTILLSLIGGYPTGARGIKALLKNNSITEEQAARMIMFCVGAGPAFVVSALGANMLNNTYIGVILFMSQVISSIILGIIVSGFSGNITVKSKQDSKISMSFSEALVTSCKDSSKGIISICSFVILFSSFLEIIENSIVYKKFITILDVFGTPEYIKNTVVAALFEVTSTTFKLVKFHAPLEIIAVVLGFSGLAVHFQVFSCIGNLKFSKIKFLIFRFLHGIISAIIVRFLIYAIPIKQAMTVFNHNNSKTLHHAVLPSSIALVILCFCFLITISPKIIDFNFKNKKRGQLNEQRKYYKNKGKHKKKLFK